MTAADWERIALERLKEIAVLRVMLSEHGVTSDEINARVRARLEATA